MGKNKRKDVVQKYSVIQNVVFCLANVWCWDRSFYIGFIPKIILSVLLPLATVYFSRILINMISDKVSQADLLIFIGTFCVLVALFDMVSVFANAKINVRHGIFSTRYSDICEKKYRTTDYENTENPKINDLYSNATGKTYDAENMVDSLSSMFISLLGIAVFGSVIILLDPIILLLIVGCAAANFFMFKTVQAFTSKNWRKWAPIDRRIWYFFELNYAFEKVKDNKLYPYPKLINEMTDQCHTERMYWYKKVWNREALPSIIDVLLAFLRNGVVYYILLKQLLDGQIDVGLFIFYFGAVTQFSGWLNGIAQQFSGIMQISINVNFIRSFLEIEERFNNGSTKQTGISVPPYDIVLKNLSYSYPDGEYDIIKNVSIKIKRGEKVALVGTNGAGKTTLVKLICGLYYPKNGDVLINGTSIRDINIDEYYQLFSVVFQDIHLMPITIAQFVSGNGVDIARERVEKCLEKAGLFDKVRRCPRSIDTTFYRDIYEETDPGIDLSGGEKQRLLLARALYKDAPILILDEPTASLDPIAESEIYQKFDELTKDKTALYISHRLASTRFCDRILFIENGRITECGSHAQLMAQKGKYCEMYEIQSHYYKDTLSEEVTA